MHACGNMAYIINVQYSCEGFSVNLCEEGPMAVSC